MKTVAGNVVQLDFHIDAPVLSAGPLHFLDRNAFLSIGLYDCQAPYVFQRCCDEIILGLLMYGCIYPASAAQYSQKEGRT